jgi:hypothetical protein
LALDNIELVFDAAIVHFQFLVYVSYESCRFATVIQTVGKIIDFFPFTSVTENELVSLYFGFAAAISNSSSSNASGHPKKVKGGESPPFTRYTSLTQLVEKVDRFSVIDQEHHFPRCTIVLRILARGLEATNTGARRRRGVVYEVELSPLVG